MRICSVCKRISATDQDHTDCIQKRRTELQDEDRKGGLAEKLNAQYADPKDLPVEMRAILEQLKRDKDGQAGA